jgi:hypothetical protein
MRQRVIAEVESGASRREAAEEFDVSASTAIIRGMAAQLSDAIQSRQSALLWLHGQAAAIRHGWLVFIDGGSEIGAIPLCAFSLLNGISIGFRSGEYHISRSISSHRAIANVGQIRAVQHRTEHSLFERLDFIWRRLCGGTIGPAAHRRHFGLLPSRYCCDRTANAGRLAVAGRSS